MTRDEFIGRATILILAFTLGIFFIAVYAAGYSTLAVGIGLIALTIGIGAAMSAYSDMQKRGTIKEKSVYVEDQDDYLH